MIYKLLFFIYFSSLGLYAQNVKDSLNRKKGRWIIYKGKGEKRKKIECFYKNDTIQGKYYVYDSKNNLEVEKEYTDGVLNGYFYVYNSDGKIIIKSFYKQGMIDGEFVTFYSNGSLYSKLIFDNGLPVSNYETYEEDGTLIREYVLHKSQFFFHKVYYYHLGEIYIKTNLYYEIPSIFILNNPENYNINLINWMKQSKKIKNREKYAKKIYDLDFK